MNEVLHLLKESEFQEGGWGAYDAQDGQNAISSLSQQSYVWLDVYVMLDG